ncbi:conserved hypothetical protein [Ricinus communis]|uniref:Uncharacterized protein n=1 Tax=Ricinus communis TaxID=3988 RepID=B9THY1_RICCO|nr:conserved hypothetical protein [Ricinus communis]
MWSRNGVAEPNSRRFHRHAVVVDDRADVAVGAADRADALDQRVGQRLRHALERERVDRRAVQFRFHAVEEAVAGPQQLVGGDAALGRADFDAFPVGHFDGGRIFVDFRSVSGQGQCLAQQQVQRVHVAAAHMEQGAVVRVGADDGLDVGTFQVADLVLRVQRLEVLFPRAQRLALARVEAHVAVAAAKVGHDAVFVDAVLDDVGAQVADLEDRAHAVFADVLPDLVQVVADAGHDLAAVAARPAEAEIARLQQGDVLETLFRQLECRVDAAESAADDDDVDVDVLLEAGEAEIVLLGCRVIGRCFDIDHDAPCSTAGVGRPVGDASIGGGVRTPLSKTGRRAQRTACRFSILLPLY